MAALPLNLLAVSRRIDAPGPWRIVISLPWRKPWRPRGPTSGRAIGAA